MEEREGVIDAVSIVAAVVYTMQKRQQKVLSCPHCMHAQMFWYNAELNDFKHFKIWLWARASSLSSSRFKRKDIYTQNKLLVIMSSLASPDWVQEDRKCNMDVSHQVVEGFWSGR